jgi:hypothetical protein
MLKTESNRVMKMLDAILYMVGVCRHTKLSFPITLLRGDEKVTYRVCLICCRQYEATLGEEALGPEIK